MNEKTERLKQYEFHEYANIYPLATKEEHEVLVEDIRKNKQSEKITLYQGKILDGRNRYNACVELGLKVKTEKLPEGEDPLAFVFSKNSARRHMTTSQKAMVGVKFQEHYAAMAKERKLARLKQNSENPCDSTDRGNSPEREGRARDQAGATVGVSGDSIDAAAKVVKDGAPELADAVVSGDVAVSTAADLVKAVPDKEKQAEIVKQGPDAVKAAAAKPRKEKKKEEPPAPTASEDIVDPLTRLSALMDQCDLVDVQRLLFEKLGGLVTQQEFLAQNFPEHVQQSSEPAKVVVQSLPFVEPCGGPEQASKQLFESFEIEEQEVVFDTINALWSAAKIGRKGKRFVKPTPEQIQEYCEERKNGLSGQEIWDYYESQGWKKSNGVAVKDWQATVRTWENKRSGESKPLQETKSMTYPDLPPRPMGISQELKDKFAKMPPVKSDD